MLHLAMVIVQPHDSKLHRDPPTPKKTAAPQPISTCWLLICDQSRDKKHTTCITLDDPDCRFWCSTGRPSSSYLSCLAENDGGFHRSRTSLWAHCAKTCSPEEHASEERCKQPPKTGHFYQDEFTSRFFLQCVVVTNLSLSNCDYLYVY